MNSELLHGFLKESDIVQTRKGVTLTSAFRVFLQAKSMIIDSHKNLADVLDVIDAIVSSDAYEMGLLGSEISKGLKTFRVLAKAWIKHSMFVINSGLEEEGRMELPNAELKKAYQEISEFSQSRENLQENKLVVFPIEERFSDDNPDESMDMTNFLNAIGFNLARSSHLTMEEAIRILLSAKTFLVDAFENARRADSIMNRILDASDEVHAMLGDEIMDEINWLGGRNRGWIIHVGKTVIGKNLILEEGSVKDQEMPDNCVRMKPRKNEFTQKTNVRSEEATVHSMF